MYGSTDTRGSNGTKRLSYYLNCRQINWSRLSFNIQSWLMN